VLNNRISEHIFTLLNQIGIPTHFIRRLNMREQLIRQVEIIPLEVVVRNVAAGSLSSGSGIEEGTQLPRTIIEYLLQGRRARRSDGRRRAHRRFGWASQEEMTTSCRHGDPRERLPVRPVRRHRHPPRRLQARVRPDLGERLMRIILADEISPDGCRLWDMKTNEKLDKDRFRRDLGGEAEAYQEVARRLGLCPRLVFSDLGDSSAAQLNHRYS
jgi:phosphoribosylaminoimidazole-succinocarboxamide synthase